MLGCVATSLPDDAMARLFDAARVIGAAAEGALECWRGGPVVIARRADGTLLVEPLAPVAGASDG